MYIINPSKKIKIRFFNEDNYCMEFEINNYDRGTCGKFYLTYKNA